MSDNPVHDSYLRAKLKKDCLPKHSIRKSGHGSASQDSYTVSPDTAVSWIIYLRTDLLPTFFLHAAHTELPLLLVGPCVAVLRDSFCSASIQVAKANMDLIADTAVISRDRLRLFLRCLRLARTSPLPKR